MTVNNQTANKQTCRLNNRYINDIKKGYEYRCLFTAIEGYKSMRDAGEYSHTWEEERLTAVMVKYMTHSPYCQTWKLDITTEFPVHTHEIYKGKKKPKQAPRIDIRIMNWSSPRKFEFFLEAKNLAEHNWQKPGGSTVNAPYLRARYIDTGIDNFVTGRYPHGGLLGYILEGNPKNIIETVNNLLKSKRRNRPNEIISPANPINGHRECYQSKHVKKNKDQLVLNHVFLNFSPQNHQI